MDSLAPALVFVFVLALFIRLPTSSPNLLEHDFYGHIYEARLIRRAKTIPFGPISLGLKFSAPYYGPFLWNWLVSFIPLGFLKKRQNLLNPLLDSLFSTLVFLWLYALGIPPFFAVMGTAVYLLSPSNYSRIVNGPRIAAFTPRLTSEILVASFFMVGMFSNQGDVWAYFVQFALAALVVASSKFGIQALIIISMLGVCLGLDFGPILTVFSALVFWFLVRPKSFYRALRVHWGQARDRFWVERSSPTSTVRAYQQIVTLITRPSIRSVKALSAHPLAQLIFLLPVIPLLVFSIDLRGGNFPFDYETAVFLSALIAWLGTSIRFGRFLGQSERYLRHTFPLAILILVEHTSDSESFYLIGFVLVHGLLFWCVDVLLFTFWLRRKRRALEVAKSEVVSFLRQISKRCTLACFPQHAGVGVWGFLLETRHTVVGDIHLRGVTHLPRSVFGDYPYFSIRGLHENRDLLSLNLVVFDLQHIFNKHAEFNWEANGWRKIFLNSRYLIIEYVGQ